MNVQTGITESLAVLEKIDLARPNRPPAVIVMPPDMGDFIIGNPAGFVQLAMAALKAAQGQEQVFSRKAWFSDYEPDWQLKGLKLDPGAHLYLPPERSLWWGIIRQFLWYGLLLLNVGIWVAGFFAVVHRIW